MDAFKKLTCLFIFLLNSALAYGYEAGSYSAITEKNLTDIFTFTSDDSQYLGYIKFSILLDLGKKYKKTYFQNQKYKFHADFLKTLPPFKGMTPKEIDEISLHNEGRKILSGTLLFPKDDSSTAMAAPWKLHLQISSSEKDPIEALEVSRMIAHLKQIQKEDKISKISYFPAPEQRKYVEENQKKFSELNIEVVTTLSNATRACYSSSWSVGVVKVLKSTEVQSAFEKGEINEETILVLDEVPEDLPMVAGLITGSQTAPSSHVALLAQMMGSPFYFEKDAQNSKKWKNHEALNKPIYLNVSGETGMGCYVTVKSGEDLNEQETEKLLELKKPQPVPPRSYNSSAKEVIDLNKLAQKGVPLEKDILLVGAKAANVAQLMKIIPGNTVTGGMAIPISFFHVYLKEGTLNNKSIYSLILPRLKKLTSKKLNMREVFEELQEIRDTLEKGEVPPTLKKKILIALSSKWKEENGTRLKLRSSSNVEDSKEFNGAGLYQSEGVCLGDEEQTGFSLCDEKKKKKPDPVIKGLKKVWASLYTTKGYLARRHFGIKELNEAEEIPIGMGVLVHKSVSDEDANGVAISKSNSSQGFKNFNVLATSFPGGENTVTGARRPGKVPESVLIDNERVDLRVRSTETPAGRMVMPDAQYRELYNAIKKVHAQYEKLLPKEERGSAQLDFEFKLINDPSKPPEGKKIYIKQVRFVPDMAGNSKNKTNIVIGSRNSGTYCPNPMERADALEKMLLSFPIKIAVGLHEIPVVDVPSIPNPVERVSLNTGTGWIEVLDKTKNLTLEYEKEWRDTFNGYESRIVSAKLPLDIQKLPDTPLRNLTLNWSVEQKRTKELSALEGKLQPFTTLQLYLTAPALTGEEYGLSYSFVSEAEKCEQDAYQNSQPGTESSWDNGTGEMDRVPRLIKKAFLGTDKKYPSLSYEGRTSVGGVDKTQFIQIDKMEISNLLSHPLNLVFTQPFKVVHAAAHHNFVEQYGADLLLADHLSAEDRREIENKNWRYFIATTFYDESNPEQPVRKLKAIVLSADGKNKTDLGEMK